MAMLQKVRDLTIYRDARFYCGPGPSAAVLEEDTVVLVFRRCRSWLAYGFVRHFHPHTEACVIRSTDGGETWSEPVVFGSGGCTNQNLRRLSDGTLLCDAHQWELLPNSVAEAWQGRVGVSAGREWPSALVGTYALRSTDGGGTWDGPFWVQDIPGIEPLAEGWVSPVAVRNPVEEFPDGTVLLPVYTVEHPNRSLLVASTDGGRTWTYRGEIARSPDGKIGFNETSVHRCPSGKVVAFMRSADAEGWLYTAVSRDEGGTWSPPKREDCWGHPFNAATLPSGNVLLCYGYRREPFGVRARLLSPECEDIGTAPELVLRDDGVQGDLGYPDMTVRKDLSDARQAAGRWWWGI